MKDASFFYDGYQVTCGDAVRIGDGAPVRIKAVNYQTNLLTVEGLVTFHAGDAVNLAIGSSKHPDIGAVPYGAENPVVPACGGK